MSKEQQVTEHGPGIQETGDEGPRCPSCGASVAASDRYCAECGAALPPAPGNAAHPAADDPWPLPAAPSPAEVEASASVGAAEAPQQDSLWLLGASPTTVIGGGVLLLVLAAALLFAGQREATGTVVMLSICLAPLALLTMAIGIARAIGGTMRGSGRS